MSRTWTPNEPVAEFRGGRWRLGVVTSVDTWTVVAIRWDAGELVSFRSPTDQHLTDPDQVPIDERHWLDQDERDQLVRQEAATRVRALTELLPVDGRDGRRGRLLMLDTLAEDFEDRLLDDEPGDYAAAARALLNPAPQPATTPTTEGLPA